LATAFFLGKNGGTLSNASHVGPFFFQTGEDQNTSFKKAKQNKGANGPGSAIFLFLRYYTTQVKDFICNFVLKFLVFNHELNNKLCSKMGCAHKILGL